MGLAKIINTGAKVGIAASVLGGVYLIREVINEPTDYTFIGVYGTAVTCVASCIIENFSKPIENYLEDN